MHEHSAVHSDAYLHEPETCRRFAYSSGLSVFVENAYRVHVSIDPTGQLTVRTGTRSGVSVQLEHPSGPRELRVSMDPSDTGAWDELRSRSLRLPGMPPGTYTHVERPNIHQYATPDDVWSTARLLAGAHAATPVSDSAMRIVVDAEWRRVSICHPDTAPVTKVESWGRLSTFVYDNSGRDLGKSTKAFASPLPPSAVDNGLQIADWVTETAIRLSIDQALSQAARLRDASPTPTGRHHLILDSRPAGTITHEFIGHLLEADNVMLRGAPEELQVGGRIGPDFFSVSHDGTARYPWSGADTDDEGTPSTRRELVRDGVVVGHLTDRRTTSQLSRVRGSGARGHARRAGFDVPIMPRMSTIVLHPSGSGTDDLGDVPEGLLVRSFSGAVMQPGSGSCIAKIREATLIEKGRATVPTRGGTLRCGIAEALATLEGVGDQAIFSEAICLKGEQPLPTGAVAPSLRFTSLVVE